MGEFVAVNKQEESLELFKNGERVAQEFLKKWNFKDWKKKYRQQLLTLSQSALSIVSGPVSCFSASAFAQRGR